MILAAFPLYGGGQVLLGGGQPTIGLLLVLANSLAVITIGLLFWPIISRSSARVAQIYALARIVEGLALAAGVVLWTTLGDTSAGQDYNAQFYRLAMSALALGSLPFCIWMIRSRFAPALVGWAGFLGYIALGVAMALQLLGLEELSMWLLIPGALFEAVFGVMLIAGRVGFNRAP